MTVTIDKATLQAAATALMLAGDDSRREGCAGEAERRYELSKRLREAVTDAVVRQDGAQRRVI